VVTKSIPPIAIELSGGIGNQLFQFCAAVYVSRETGREFKFDTLNLTLSRLPGVQRRRLSIGELLEQHEIHSIAQASYLRLSTRKSRVLWEEGPLDDPLERVSETTLRVFGYFQRLEIVERTYEDLVKRMLRSNVTNILQRNRLEARIAVHVRRGDYLTAKARSYHGLIERDYFMDAIQFASSKTGIRSVLLVSDDPKAASELLLRPLQSDGFLVLPHRQASEWIDLAALANSAAVVMSNSSFSWWGAYFGFKQHRALVVAPIPWLATCSGFEAVLLAEEWHKIRRNSGSRSIEE